MRISAVFGALLVVSSSLAYASPVTSLYNTGVDASGNTLGNALGDPHYNLISVPSGSSAATRTLTTGYPLPDGGGPYLPNDGLSDWIGPNNDAQLNGPVGLYDYETTFSLTGFNPFSASITGQLATDNPITNILLNGQSLSFGFYGNTGFQSWTSFTIGAGSPFVAGTNTLDFVVQNQGGPTALRVEMSATATATAPDSPVPFTLELATIGAVLLLANRRRRMGVASI